MSRTALRTIQAAAGNVADGGFYPYTVDNSARFNESDSAFLYRTAGTPTDQNRFTCSTWFKNNKPTGKSTNHCIFSAGNVYGYAKVNMSVTGAGSIRWNYDSTSMNAVKITNALHRDSSAWYHLVFAVDTDNATANDRVKIYVNGVRLTSFSSDTNPGSGDYYEWNQSGQVQNIGRRLSTGPTSYIDLYLAQTAMVDGQQLDPTSFGEFKNGIWVPKDLSGLTFGNNGFWLDFADSSNFGNDVSGNNNDWTSSGLTSSDQMIDTPSNNFYTASIMSGRIGYTPTMSEGNLKASNSNSQRAVGNGLPTSGEWYWEIQSPNVYSGSGYRYYVGICFGNSADEASLQRVILCGGGTYVGIDYQAFGTNYGTGSNSGGPGDVCGLYLNADAQEFSMYVADTLVATVDISSADLSKMCLYHGADGTPSRPADTILHFNFGQNGDFNGAETAQGNTDANGIGDFYYTPKGNSLALCTANFPEPTIGPNIDSDDTTALPEDQFSILLYEGNSTNDRDITGVGFDPDLGIFKNRDEAYGWIVVDRNRGDGWSVGIDGGGQESGTGKFDSFITDGYRIDSHPGLNRSSIVNYSWKAGGTASSNTDGTISSNVSVNGDAKISIITYTGTGASSGTVGHGLGVTPDVLIHKGLYSGSTWYYKSAKQLGAWTYNLRLELNNSLLSGSTDINNASTTTFSTGTSTSVNGSGNNFVAYAFSEVESFSSFGKYIGNGNSDGPFIFTGMRPAWVLIKNTSASNSWLLYDTKRIGYNQSNNYLLPDLSNAEGSGDNYIDILSNGFKVRVGAQSINTSGNTYIYMAFAENPFKYSNAR